MRALLMLPLLLPAIAPEARADRERPEVLPCCAARPVLNYEHPTPKPSEHERTVVLNLGYAYARHLTDCMWKHDVPRFDLELTFARGANVARPVRTTGPAAFRACAEDTHWSHFGPAPSARVVRLRVSSTELVERERRRERERQEAQRRRRR